MPKTKMDRKEELLAELKKIEERELLSSQPERIDELEKNIIKIWDAVSELNDVVTQMINEKK